MFIRHLSLTNFRSLNRLELDLTSRLTLLHGENAQGKTSIIEAIHLCSLMTSTIASQDRELVNFLSLGDAQPFCRIVADIEKEEKPHRLDFRLVVNQNQNGEQRLLKEFFLDGVKRRFFQMVGFFNSVLFIPQMTRIIEDSPDERRKYLDQTLSQAYPGYARELVEYNKAISRRNSLLKQLFESGGDEAQLLYWDQIISEKGAFIIHTRKNAVSALSQLVSHQHNKLTEGREFLFLKYLPSYYPLIQDTKQKKLIDQDVDLPDYDLKQIQENFFGDLQRSHHQEINRGVTLIGPHRDDLGFFANEVDLRVYGSRGQVRTAMMSMKLAETLWLQEKSGELPVILLDETLAELDTHRRQQLLNIITDGWQAIFTTADISLFPDDFIERCTVWEVRSGQVFKNNL